MNIVQIISFLGRIRYNECEVKRSLGATDPVAKPDQQPEARSTGGAAPVNDRSVRAGDPFAYAGDKKNGGRPPTRTIRHHRCDEAFLDLLQEDFGIARFALNMAFMGCPREPKKAAIEISAWAARQDDPDRALLAWARKNRRGSFASSAMEDLDEGAEPGDAGEAAGRS
jgi:hypothetical protein